MSFTTLHPVVAVAGPAITARLAYGRVPGETPAPTQAGRAVPARLA
jgi:hypothetical protein